MEIKRSNIIGLITDFGRRGSHYVAAMKSVIKKTNENAEIIDISHDVAPFSIVEANFMIYYALRDFPSGSVIVCVVDPGVGTDRKIIAARTKSNITIIGPDNGIFSLASSKYYLKEIYMIERQSLFYKGLGGISSTFHGRDIMAPVAARLLGGKSLAEVGKPVAVNKISIDTDIMGPNFIGDNELECKILFIDDFGNIITNISELDIKHLANSKSIHLIYPEKIKLNLCNTFSELKSQELGFLLGSTEFMEISMRKESAADNLVVKSGDSLKIKFEIDQQLKK